MGVASGEEDGTGQVLLAREQREGGGDVELVQNSGVTAERGDVAKDLLEDGLKDVFLLRADAQTRGGDGFAEFGPFLFSLHQFRCGGRVSG